ncbi:MAG: hypothetical protein WEB37_01190 [Bacteroidota bacterium]
MKLSHAAFFLLTFLLPQSSFTQCSDAGVCSIGHRSSADLSNLISISYTFGQSGKPDDLSFHGAEVAADIGITEDSRLSFSLPFNSQSGPLGSTTGIGDLVVLWSQRLLAQSDFFLNLQGGVKFATGSVTAGGLPQAYQSGLGTTDLIFGIHGRMDGWGFALAYQLAGGRSENPVTRLQRGDDLLLRAAYTTNFKQLSLTLETLVIKSLQESSVRTSLPGQPEVYGNIPNSNQTQINLVVRGSHPITGTLHLNAFAAIPTLKRDVNVDGLKRSIAISAGFSVSL